MMNGFIGGGTDNSACSMLSAVRVQLDELLAKELRRELIDTPVDHLPESVLEP